MIEKRQLRLFGCEDLPLLSGTAPRAIDEVFDPPAIPDVVQVELSPEAPFSIEETSAHGFRVHFEDQVVTVYFDGMRYWGEYRPQPGAAPVSSAGIPDRRWMIDWARRILADYAGYGEV